MYIRKALNSIKKTKLRETAEMIALSEDHTVTFNRHKLYDDWKLLLKLPKGAVRQYGRLS